MQIDMHFYGTYAIARLAGFERDDARIIATAAQFVDDATDNDSEKNTENEMLFAICTAHHSRGAVATSAFNKEAHRLVWIPFHFYPGGKGKTLEERLICTKDSDIINQMMNNHIQLYEKAFYLHLLGIGAHVYLDSFAHYGFSGICSDLNKVDNNSIEYGTENETILEYIENKRKLFVDKYVKGPLAETSAAGLGHAGVATLPDRPFLKWKFKYEEERWGNGVESGWRDNPQTYLEGLTKLYELLKEAARKKYSNPQINEFPEDKIKSVISEEADKEGRIKKWEEFIHAYDGDESARDMVDEWNTQKENFHDMESPKGIGDCYKFHQAAAYHRWYTLKDLLPEHGIYAV